MVVWKYELNPYKPCKIEMPENAEILTCMMQGKSLCFWALVNPEAKRVVRCFALYATGRPLDDYKMQYIGTYQIDGYFMFHLFELLD